MESLILDGGPIQAAFEAGDDQAVVDALNSPTLQEKKTGDERRPGFSSNATMGRDLGQDAVAQFLAVMDGAAQANRALGTPQGNATAILLESFVARFNTTPDGIDFSNDDIRAQITAIMTASGIDPQPYLALGYSFVSLSQSKAGRLATIEDVEAVRLEVEERARVQGIDSFQAMLENTWIEVAKTDGTTTAEQLRALIKAGL